jgi:hypothetical protein
MSNSRHRTLLVLLLLYVAASLVHFAHNAEFIRDYPGLPPTWTREGVYIAWIALTALGVLGWHLITRGYEIAGAIVVAGYALLGLDSLGHYVAAPFSAHTPTMNVTILLEVTCAALVLVQVLRLIVQRVRRDAGAGPEL